LQRDHKKITNASTNTRGIVRFVYPTDVALDNNFQPPCHSFVFNPSRCTRRARVAFSEENTSFNDRVLALGRILHARFGVRELLLTLICCVRGKSITTDLIFGRHARRLNTKIFRVSTYFAGSITTALCNAIIVFSFLK